LAINAPFVASQSYMSVPNGAAINAPIGLIPRPTESDYGLPSAR
jgi:hypothetical protein